MRRFDEVEVWGHRRRMPRFTCPTLDKEYRAQAEIWLLRLLQEIGLDPDDSDQARLLSALKLPEITADKRSRAEMWRALRARLASRESRPIRRGGALFENLARLESLFGLSMVEQELLAFAVLLHNHRLLRFVATGISFSSEQLMDLLAATLALDLGEVRRALRSDGILQSAGLLQVSPYPETLGEALALLDDLDGVLLGEQSDPLTMFDRYFRPSREATLSLDDFAYIEKEIMVMRSLFACPAQDRTPGVNVLLYGRPGTGKTEFARALSRALGLTLYDVSFQGPDRDPKGRPRRDRFRAFQLCQHLLHRQRGAVVLFDEVEDVFPPEWGGVDEGEGWRPSKAWVNHVLETNPVPAIWISNQIFQINSAHLRRFLFTIEFRIPPRSVRKTMLTRALADVPVGAGWIERTAAIEALTPALIEQVSRVGRLTNPAEPAGPAAVEERLSLVLRNSLEARGGARYLPQGAPAPVTRYQLDFVNASERLEPLVEGLKRRPSARLCLSGPPGTGKTAFAYYLAEQLDRPLVKKLASDLLDCFVGATEKHIATMFRQALEEKAVLLLDEADSFLRDRRDALHTWEITQVNELLVHMEAFEGIFVCSTNLMDCLDMAVIRRFDLKIQFSYLRPDQVWNLFLHMLHGLGMENPNPETAVTLRRRLWGLDNLTPGDFAVVARKAQIGGLRDVGELASALEQETRLKRDQRMWVRGFVS